jgi:hypothetical protein
MIELNTNPIWYFTFNKNSSYLSLQATYKDYHKTAISELCINFNPMGLEAVFLVSNFQKHFKNDILSENKMDSIV